ncbi:hypothetical protein BH09BAC3_BH09BAC3_19790 [soil metagenome]
MTDLKYILMLAVLIGTGCSTKQEENLFTGDLYFARIRFGSYYNLTDSIRQRIVNVMDTVAIARADSSSRAFIEIFNKLDAEGMLYKPYVDLKVGENSYVKLYMDSTDYNEIKVYKRKFLQNAHKKVIIKAHTREIGNMSLPLLYCVKLVDVRVVDGETLPYGSKFTIDDYQ